MQEYIRSVNVSVYLLILIASIPMTVGAAGSDDNPNIVLILMDNFGYGEPGVYGGGAIRGAPTPNIDSIAHEGFQLTNYNVDSECTPSRTSLMTGRYSMRTRYSWSANIKLESAKEAANDPKRTSEPYNIQHDG